MPSTSVASIVQYGSKIWRYSLRHACVRWLIVFILPMVYFLVYRLVALPAILKMFTTPSQRTAKVKVGGVVLGILEDFSMTAILFFALWIFEVIGAVGHARLPIRHANRLEVLICGRLVRFIGSLAFVVLILSPFAADMLLIRTRQMRFTMEFIQMYNREKQEASSLEVGHREARLAKETIGGTLVFSVFFAFAYTTIYTTKEHAKPAKVRAVSAAGRQAGAAPAGIQYQWPERKESSSGEETKGQTKLDEKRPNEDAGEDLPAAKSADDGHDADDVGTMVRVKSAMSKKWYRRRKVRLGFVSVLTFIVVTVIAGVSSNAAPPYVSSIALNMSLNELFRSISRFQFQPSPDKGKYESAKFFIHSDTEDFTLYADDSLYRRTNGFKGKLAFDISVDQNDLPNVLVIAVESMRYSDSLYTSSAYAGGSILKQHGFSVTPNFDRWAKRGISFSNMWSSWQTSRSVESILFGQIPLDAVTETGLTTGRPDIELAGMPQFFKKRGYETVFATGCTIKYDQWDIFLSTHGFDQVFGEPDVRALAQRDFKISDSSWIAEKRAYGWGVHDDLSFQVLGNLIINKTQEQQERVKKGEAKRPFFLNHYTITSHMPFEARSLWYTRDKIPDFSPLYTGKQYTNEIRNYADLRYFTDVELGKFLDRLDTVGVLKDLIVVIVGDHGQSPEFGLAIPYDDQVSVTRVPGAIIAEGRLGKYAGLQLNDTVEHYDLLNTLMDVIGVPSEGFNQTGVGRSLKRQASPGSRAVWSNNPLKKKSVIRGDKRLVYDTITDAVSLHDARTDPLATTDLFAGLSSEDQKRWLKYRDAGRYLNGYFKHRWSAKCLANIACGAT